MSYRIVKQYRATGGLTMTEDGFFTIIDPGYYENAKQGKIHSKRSHRGHRKGERASQA